jgi:hypothetical protein
MTYRGHQGAGCEQRDDDGGAQGANGDGGHGTPPEGWLISADHYAALPVTGFAAHDSPVTSLAPPIAGSGAFRDEFAVRVPSYPA